MKLLYILVQCTWGLPQTLLGAALFLRYRTCRHFFFHGAVATRYPLASSVSLGLFVFVSDHPPRDRRRENPIPDREIGRRLLVHEYGHTIQSLILGPLYLPVIGLPSALWNHLPCCRQKRRTGTSYFRFYTEKNANQMGEKFTGEKSMECALI